MNTYALIVYLTIVSSAYHWQKSSPTYLLEKSDILRLDERDAWGFGYLDRHNMHRAIEYCESWKLEVPLSWSDEVKAQDEAAQDLESRGVMTGL